MSKHEKTLRHERKKTDRTRRRGSLFRNPGTSPTCGSAIRNGAAALAAAAVIAAGTTAYADPVRYDNAAGFDWTTTPGVNVLDIRFDSFSQPGTDGIPGAFSFGAYPFGNLVRGQSAGGQVQEVYNGYNDLLPGVDAGVPIPSGFAWGTTAYVTNSDIYPGFEYTLLPEGEQTYLGVRFDQGAGNQYGWIGVVRTGMDLDTFAWGYETTPGVAIPAGIPEPGSLALLAFGALAVAGRRRR